MNIFTWLKELFRRKEERLPQYTKPLDALFEEYPAATPLTDIFNRIILRKILLWSDPATSEEELGEYMRTKGGDAYGLRSRKNMES